MMKKIKILSGLYENPIEIPIMRNNHFHLLRSLKIGAEQLVFIGNF